MDVYFRQTNVLGTMFEVVINDIRKNTVHEISETLM